MTTLALIRHGETDWNSKGLIQGITDVPLNEVGFAQAAKVANDVELRGSGRTWDGVITSPLARAQVTGRVIAETLDLPLLPPVSQLAERDYGEMEGVEITRARELYPAGDYPGSEHNDSVFERSLRAIDTLRVSHGDRAYIVVAHGGLLHTLLSRLHGARLPSIENATVNIVEYGSERWHLSVVNGERITSTTG